MEEVGPLEKTEPKNNNDKEQQEDIAVTNGGTDLKSHDLEPESHDQNGTIVVEEDEVKGGPQEDVEDKESQSDDLVPIEEVSSEGEWKFPPVLDQFDLMETETDPTELEAIFMDERFV